MRALLCEKPFQLRLVERPTPELPPEWARVRIRRAGVCGTDLHIFDGSQPYFAYPRVIGHELAGEVEAVAPGGRLHIGQRVAVIPYIHCGRCIACRRGRTNCCQTLNVVGVHSDGGMADFICLPAANLIDAESVSLDDAAMIEFLAIGAHAVRRGGVAPGQTALIVGTGPIGVATALFAKMAGAEVTILEGRQDRREFARDVLGVTHTVPLGADTRDELGVLTKGEFFDCVFDCTGSPKAMEAGFAYVAHGGNYVLVSIVQGQISFSDPEFHKRECTLLSSRNATLQDFERVLSAIQSGLIPTKQFATHRATLEEAPAAFAEWLKPEAHVLKALIEI